ncbi:MAG: class I SAM-dependent methyltransferase [Syntrophobacteraceae bacterium]
MSSNGNDSHEKIDFYAMAAPFYDLLTVPFLKSGRRDIVRAAKALQCRRILDVACGTGEQARMLARAGLTVSGIDLSPAMLAVARRKSPQTVAFFRGTAESMPFASASFDCVTISLALHEMADETRTGAVTEIVRVLAPGGKLIVYDYAALRNRASAPGLALMGLVEKMAGREHFKNFVRFTRSGGIEKFLRPFPFQKINYSHSFPGALQIVSLKKTDERVR